MDDKSNQIKRLDQADKSMTGNDAEFMSVPPLANVLDEFTSSMLPKPSQATNMLDLQVEFEKLRIQNLITQDADMEDESAEKKPQINIDFKFKDYFTFWIENFNQNFN